MEEKTRSCGVFIIVIKITFVDFPKDMSTFIDVVVYKIFSRHTEGCHCSPRVHPTDVCRVKP